MSETSLKEKEYHPSADSAMTWFKMFVASDTVRFLQIREALASTALSGNRLAEICLSTLDRLSSGRPVSDRYLLGLCWFLRDMIEGTTYGKQKNSKRKKNKNSHSGRPSTDLGKH